MINFFRKLMGKKPKYRVKAWNIERGLEWLNPSTGRRWISKMPDNCAEMTVSEWVVWKHREARGLN